MSVRCATPVQPVALRRVVEFLRGHGAEAFNALHGVGASIAGKIHDTPGPRELNRVRCLIACGLKVAGREPQCCPFW